jgi:hypothetical protein
LTNIGFLADQLLVTEFYTYLELTPVRFRNGVEVNEAPAQTAA